LEAIADIFTKKMDASIKKSAKVRLVPGVLMAR
jgi:hypothetical protein